jgi:hypothetical protein
VNNYERYKNQSPNTSQNYRTRILCNGKKNGVPRLCAVLKIASAFSAKILLSGKLFGEVSAKI